MNYNKEPRNTLKRIPNRGHYDRKNVFKILDGVSLCHVGFHWENQVYVIPMAYGRNEDVLYLHGSVKGRFTTMSDQNVPVSIGVTCLDGLVLARSAFHSSMNYRSVVVFGKMQSVQDFEAKRNAMRVITNHILPGRWEELRPPTDKEINLTAIMEVEIESASAKIRTGPPVDDSSDLQEPVWAGVIPFQTQLRPPIDAVDLQVGCGLSASVQNLYETKY